MVVDELPLFRWQPPVSIIVFPQARRRGRIREVAARLYQKPTARARRSYCEQVNESLARSLQRAGVSQVEISVQLTAFWREVSAEELRIAYRDNSPAGAA